MVNVSAEITSVNLFRRGADIIRTGHAELHEGRQILRFCGIPESADGNTVRIFGEAGILCSDFRFLGPGAGDAESSGAQELSEELRRLQEKKEVKELQIALWKTNGDFTGRISSNAADVQEYIEKLPVRIGELREEIAGLQKEMDALEKKKAELLRQERLPAVIAEVTAEKAGTYSFTVRYHDASASWEPLYEIHSDGEGPVEFRLRARMKQNTGEDWDNVRLSLFTGVPSASVVMPELFPLFLDFREERPAPRTVMPQMMMGMAMAQASGGAMPMQDALSSGETSVRLTTEEAEEKSDDTMTEYVIPDRKSIRGNGEESLADLRNYIVPAKYHIVTAPKEDPGVFLMAEIDSGDYPFSGTQNISVYLKDRYSGSWFLTPDLSGEKDSFTLGRDERVQTGRREVLRKTGGVLLKGQKVTEYRYETTLANVSNRDLTVLLKDQIPVSRNKDITVSTLDLSGAVPEADTGFVTREIALPAGERKTVVTAYKVAWPKEKQLEEKKGSTAAQNAKTVFCPVCGARTEGRFCTTCGSKLP